MVMCESFFSVIFGLFIASLCVMAILEMMERQDEDT